MEHLSQYEKEERPWGAFERFTLNEKTTVKIITVKANEAFSLQTHTNRDEFWRILSGSATITVGETVVQGKTGDDFYCARNTKHRVEAGDSDVVFLEIAFGEFDEQDITRLEDRYNRT